MHVLLIIERDGVKVRGGAVVKGRAIVRGGVMIKDEVTDAPLL